MTNSQAPFSERHPALQLVLQVSGAALAGLVVAAILHPLIHHKSNRPMTAAERVELNREHDREVLDMRNPDKADMYGALVRLSQNKEERARHEGLVRANDPSPLVRAGAANGLGYFDDKQSLAALAKLAEDPDENVRIQAMIGLGHSQSAEREALLEKNVGSRSAGPAEIVAAWSSMLTAAPGAVKQDTALGILVELAQSPKIPRNQQVIAAMRALSSSPHDKRVIEMLRNFVSKGDNPAVVPVAIRQLASIRDEGLMKAFPKLAQNREVQVRLAAIQSLRFACYPHRISLLNDVIRRDDNRMMVQAAIRELTAMPGPEAEKTLQKVVDDGVLKDHDEDYRAARNAIVEVKRAEGGKVQDPCTESSSAKPHGKT
jgi:HEAT repeat protein